MNPLLAPELERAYGAAMNEAQRRVVGHAERPLLVIAGPGSGKTFSLVLRTMKARPFLMPVFPLASLVVRLHLRRAASLLRPM